MLLTAEPHEEQNRIVLFYFNGWRWRVVSMADLHQTRDPDPNTGINAVGWLFLAFASAIIAVAAVIAYEANDTRVTNAPMSQMVAR